MTKLKKLLESYTEFISIPWSHNIDPEQRIVFCVYNEIDENRIRAKVGEFEIATKQAGHDWNLFDLTDIYPKFVINEKYAEKLYRTPSKAKTAIGSRFLPHIIEEYESFLKNIPNDPESVVAVLGAGTLYSVIRVKEVVDQIAPLFLGKLVVFFPGRFSENNYRLLDGYDGWSYRAIPILDM